MQAQGRRDAETPLVSVIIPVYNAESLIGRALDSLKAQTLNDFEVVAVNDGSTDDSLAVLEQRRHDFRSMTVIDQPNAGQGSARNRAIDAARGKYIFFLDADDFIESVALQVTTQRAESDHSDMVHFDWKLLPVDAKSDRDTKYYNVEPFWHQNVLDGPECDELFQVKNFYSVCNLYRRDLLVDNGIRFEEGRIYEDNPFLVQAINHAQRVSLVHSPLYVVCPQETSSTRTGITSDKHAKDHVHAVRRSFELLDRRNPRAGAYLASYHTTKFWQYYKNRVPRRFRMQYVHDFVDALHDAKVDFPAGVALSRHARLTLQLGIFQRSPYRMYRSVIAVKNCIMPRIRAGVDRARGIKRRNDPKSAWSEQLEAALRKDVIPGTISFLGMDFHFRGNSKYLFEEVISDPWFKNHEIRFVTNDPELPDEYRLVPGRVETNVALARSEVVVAESWIPPRVRKHKDSTWIQLWHGTPLKRMLFDSNEPGIISKRRQHKINKYSDIQNWDYLVADSPAAASKFETAFLFDRTHIIESGYPRVKYLLEHASDSELKAEITSQLDLPEERMLQSKFVLYAPTWRDYNYGRPKALHDFNYMLDVEELSEYLGSEWTILFHDHAYMSANAESLGSNCVDVSDVDIQDLLLISDAVVSDYSSVIFDAFALDTQVVLYAKDVKMFEKSRGLYSDMWTDLAPLVTDSVEELAGRLHQGSAKESQRALKGKYAFTERDDLLGVLKDRELTRGGEPDRQSHAENDTPVNVEK